MTRPTAPARALAAVLDTEHNDSEDPHLRLRLSLGDNLFVGPPRMIGDNVPQQAVFVLLTRGGPPTRQHETGGIHRVILTSFVTVFLRHDPHLFEQGERLSRFVWRILEHCAMPEGYIACECLDSEPEYTGTDEHQNPIWTINLRMQWED
jgi:hypothetical protein